MCQFYCCVMLMRIVQAEVVIGQCGCNETMVEQVGKQICSQHKKAAMSSPHSMQNLTSHLNPIDQTVMGLATVLPKGDRGDVGRPGRQGITGPPVTIEEAMHPSSSPHLHVAFQGAQGPSGGPGAMGVKGETGLQGERGPRGPEGLQAWLSITTNHIFLIPRARREKGERMERPARTELLDFPDLLAHLALQGDMM